MKLMQLDTLLGGNPYPGRGIVLGRSGDGKAVMAYFIMGRSQNSRNRVFEVTGDGIRTRAFDEAQMTDPSLVIYHPVRRLPGCTLVTNGDQTDTLRDVITAGGTYIDALRTRRFEPDSPNYTPRISGVLDHQRGAYCLSILKSADGDACGDHRFFFEYDCPLPGQGHFIHTYQTDGDPLPAFDGEPHRVALPHGSPQALADIMWNSLNADNKVALFVRYMDLNSGQCETTIINKL